MAFKMRSGNGTSFRKMESGYLESVGMKKELLI